MSILKSEIYLRKSAIITDTAINGGRMSKVAAVHQSRNAMFPHFSIAERQNGATRYRKFFWHIANDDDLTLMDAMVFLDGPTPAGDRITIFQGSWTDTQADIPASPTEYGAGVLASGAAAGAVSLSVTIEDAGLVIFRAGEKVRVSDGEIEEILTVASVGKSGVTVTLGIAGMLANAFPAGAAVSSLWEVGDVATGLDGFSMSSGYGGSVNYPLLTLDNIGSIYQGVTITFSSSSVFSVASDVLGSLGSGNISAICAPNNPDFTKPYFTIPSAYWEGNWGAGDIVRFTTLPAAAPLWAKCVCPAGAATNPDNEYTLRILGASA